MVVGNGVERVPAQLRGVGLYGGSVRRIERRTASGAPAIPHAAGTLISHTDGRCTVGARSNHRGIHLVYEVCCLGGAAAGHFHNLAHGVNGVTGVDAVGVI